MFPGWPCLILCFNSADIYKGPALGICLHVLLIRSSLMSFMNHMEGMFSNFFFEITPEEIVCIRKRTQKTKCMAKLLDKSCLEEPL